MNETKQYGLRDIEIRLIAELLMNSRKSDRELALALKVSQPTITRTRRRLEKEGYIREYTIIPDFRMLGYGIMGASRLEVSERTNQGLKNVRKSAQEMEEKNPNAFLMAVNGLAEQNKNRLFIVFYEAYSDYVEAIKVVKGLPFVRVDSVDTFIADLNDETNYKVLSMSALANHLLQRLKGKGKR